MSVQIGPEIDFNYVNNYYFVKHIFIETNVK